MNSNSELQNIDNENLLHELVKFLEESKDFDKHIYKNFENYCQQSGLEFIKFVNPSNNFGLTKEDSLELFAGGGVAFNLALSAFSKFAGGEVEAIKEIFYNLCIKMLNSIFEKEGKFIFNYTLDVPILVAKGGKEIFIKPYILALIDDVKNNNF